MERGPGEVNANICRSFIAPVQSPLVHRPLATLVLALAADGLGGRLGRGKGHYDATLAIARAVSVALVFEVQLVERVPLGEDDRPVAAVCTERRLILVP